MNINRHNYEEYFILYLDNELGSDERRMVDQFVQQHPDLKEELELLMQYKLIPDESVTFPAKEELIKINGHTPVTLNNYDEWLVMYADNELSAEQKVLVHDFITEHPAIQKELVLLQKTKLQPETILFPYKESLYRSEVKVRRVSLVLWWRAAAAVLILAIGLSAAFVLTRKQTDSKEEVVSAKPGEQNEPLKNMAPVLPDNNNQAPVVAEQKNTPVVPSDVTGTDKILKTQGSVKKDNVETIAGNKRSVIPENKLPENNPVVIKKEEVVTANNNPPTNNLPQPLNNPNINRVKPEDAVASNQGDKKADIQHALTNPTVTKNIAPTSDYVNTSFDSEQLEQPEGRKNKNRGFFRKIARTFEKRTNIDPTDDNKLLVAGLSIKLK